MVSGKNSVLTSIFFLKLSECKGRRKRSSDPLGKKSCFLAPSTSMFPFAWCCTCGSGLHHAAKQRFLYQDMGDYYRITRSRS